MLTEEEVNEMFRDVPLQFDSYYKYSFTFSGEKDEYKIITSFGGNGDDIYRYEVDRNVAEYFGSCDEWSSVYIKKNDEVVFSCLSY